jgi:hypothetical protein
MVASLRYLQAHTVDNRPQSEVLLCSFTFFSSLFFCCYVDSIVKQSLAKLIPQSESQVGAHIISTLAMLNHHVYQLSLRNEFFTSFLLHDMQMEDYREMYEQTESFENSMIKAGYVDQSELRLMAYMSENAVHYNNRKRQV